MRHISTKYLINLKRNLQCIMIWNQILTYYSNQVQIKYPFKIVRNLKVYSRIIIQSCSITTLIPILYYSCWKEIMWLFRPSKKALDPEHTYLRVEFLTPQEKGVKREIIKKLEKQYQDDEESIIPYEGSFQVSFRFTLNTSEISDSAEPIVNKMLLKELMCHLQVTKNQQLQDFMKCYVKDISMFILNDQMIGKNEVVPLYSEVQATIYTPSQVLEIIYEPKSLWQRIKNRGKKIIQGFPKRLFSILTKILAFIFGMMGFDTSAKSLIMRVIPMKAVIQWLITFVAAFFPMFAPFISMASKYFLG